jgi:sugar phosphate isomerase/epimerase
MSQIQGPAIFLAQFLGDAPPYDTLPNITAWVKGLGFKGVQIPSWDSRVIDIKKAAASKTYCDEIKGRTNGLAITELASHLQGQLVAVHPAYDELFDGFAPPEVRGNVKARTEWAVQQMREVIKASANFGLTVTPSFPGALLWPFMYPWPQRPAGIVEEAFKELAARCSILNYADEAASTLFELHPGEDLSTTAPASATGSVRRSSARAAINYDPSHFALQCIDYVGSSTYGSDRVSREGCRVPSVRSRAAYGAYLGWKDRGARSSATARWISRRSSRG